MSPVIPPAEGTRFALTVARDGPEARIGFAGLGDDDFLAGVCPLVNHAVKQTGPRDASSDSHEAFYAAAADQALAGFAEACSERTHGQIDAA